MIPTSAPRTRQSTWPWVLALLLGIVAIALFPLWPVSIVCAVGALVVALLYRREPNHRSITPLIVVGIVGLLLSLYSMSNFAGTTTTRDATSMVTSTR